LVEIFSQVIENETIEIDGKRFVDCVLSNCVLEYSGGPVIFDRTRMRGCRYVFFGEARRTVQFLQGTGLMPWIPTEWAEVSEHVH
jgi:hypothetical protein